MTALIAFPKLPTDLARESSLSAVNTVNRLLQRVQSVELECSAITIAKRWQWGK
jgi:hypothetical protein